MKAAVLRVPCTPLEIENVTISKPQSREVLVRVASVGVCHTDLHVVDGSYPAAMPTVLGHEVAGVVEQVGSDVRSVKPGDHVIVLYAFHCGHCPQCHSGHSYRCNPPTAQRAASEPARLARDSEQYTQYLNIGGFAEQVLVDESGCVPVHKDMPLDRACLMGCSVTTGVGAVLRTAAVQAGQSVAIVGCGGVGLSAINGAAIANAYPIIAVDPQPSKLELARTFGATHTVNPNDGDVVEQVMALNGGVGVEHAIEAVGRKDTIEAAFKMVGKGGLATVLGASRPDTLIELPAITLLLEKRLQGGLMGGVRPSIDIPNYVELYMSGQLKLDELIAARRPLAEINIALDELRSGQHARSVIVFDA